MTLRDRIHKNILFLTLTAYYLSVYFGINWLTSRRTGLHHLSLPFEERLPFVPVMILAYVLIYAYFILAFLAIDDLPFFKKVVRAFYLCIHIHFVIFLLFPVEYSLRPHVEYAWGGIYRLISFYYWMDFPYNCFPSMHISNVFLVTYLMERYRSGWGRVLLPIALLVSVSVVLVKQHYIVDVVAGYFVGWGVYRWVFGNKTQ